MAERDPAKLAAARKKLKEYQQRSRENTPVVPPQQQHLLSSTEVSLPSNREDVRKNDGSVQNYVYDSGTASVKSEKLPSTELPESLFIKDNHNNNNNNSIFNGSIETNSSANTRNIFNGNCEKPNEHYVEQLVTELNTQSLFTDNNSSNNSNIFGGMSNNNNNNNNTTSDIQSAKDFFDSLPVSSQSSVDFSFDAQIASDTPPVSISNPTVNTEVPSTGITGLDINVKNLHQDSQSDHSESVPLTPSEQDKSDISSSSVGQSPKQISQVLELQLKEIDMKLGVEINKNRILTEQLQMSRDHISQLEDSLEVCRKETEAKVAALEEKLQLHVKTLEILVSEKTELQTTLTACQESISQKAGEIEELQSRLRASRHRVGDLERELGLAQALRQQQEKAAHEATCSRDVLKNEVDLMRKHLDESTEEVLDLKHKLEEKVREVTSLNDELKEKESQLSVSQLRIEQLSSPGDGSDGLSNGQDVMISLQKDKQNLEQQIEQLNKNFKKVMSEHDEASSQYQQYVTTLNSQLQTMAAKYENVCNQRDNLSAREASLVEHIASLEKQMQQSLTRKPSPPPVVTPLQQQNAEFQQVKQQLEKVTEERKQFEDEMNSQVELNNKLTETLEEYTGRVLELERSIERLEADRPDAGLLQAAIESDKVAASRAIAQNTDLKKQLEELQDAFIKLSNSKLELTEKLELEHAQCKELTKQLAEVNSKVENDRSNLSNGSINDNEQLDQQDAVLNGVEKIDFCSQTYNVKDQDFSNITIDVEAMTKLEDKFKRKMLEVAELSDEKQRLEHLVLQLQGETETIGEYITLYQIQRGMLRQRAQEKDEQMARLSQEREVLRNKLNELNHLVQTLLPDSYNHCYEAARLGHENGDHNSVDNATEVTETECPLNSEGTTNEIVDSSPVHKHKPIEVNKEETAGKIRALLTEIGSSKLVTADGETTPNFHHCPWCSGQLITV